MGHLSNQICRYDNSILKCIKRFSNVLKYFEIYCCVKNACPKIMPMPKNYSFIDSSDLLKI